MERIMPLIEVPRHLGSPIILDILLNKSHPLNQEFSKHEEPEKENVYIINGQPFKKITLLGEQQITIFSAKGRDLFNVSNSYNLSNFIMDENICDFDTFINAIKSGSLAELQRLNFVSNHFSMTDITGNNALIWATLINATAIMEYLLKRNCPKTQKNGNGWRALDIAAYIGSEEAVTLLINNGACDDFEEEESSALFQAKQQNHPNIIKLLENKIAQNKHEYMQPKSHHQIKP